MPLFSQAEIGRSMNLAAGDCSDCTCLVLEICKIIHREPCEPSSQHYTVWNVCLNAADRWPCINFGGCALQLVQEALSAEEDPFRQSLIGSPCIPLVRANKTDMRWSLIVKNLKRRMGALLYFGAYANLQADIGIQKLISLQNLATIEW